MDVHEPKRAAEQIIRRERRACVGKEQRAKGQEQKNSRCRVNSTVGLFRLARLKLPRTQPRTNIVGFVGRILRSESIWKETNEQNTIVCCCCVPPIQGRENQQSRL